MGLCVRIFFMKITIYTDGSSKGNPGSGGWGAVVIKDNYGDPKGASVQEVGGREDNTTNNRMEMKAAIEALRLVPFAQDVFVEIHTDSEYLMKGITIWIKNWQKNGWRTKDKKEVLNKDLWQELWQETEKRKVEWKKVLGHSGHTLNERCDEIAQSFADGSPVKLFNGLKADYNTFHQDVK